MKTFIPIILCLFLSSFIGAQTLTTELFKDGFSSPVDLQNAGDSRLFVVEQSGVIKILNSDGSVNPTPFLDISSQVTSGGERGLLGIAFHPDYTSNGHFFLNYTDNSSDTQISRFTVDSSNLDIADPSSKLDIINISQPHTNHNGGCLRFGPDGYLYIGTGDGGSGGDPDNRAQNLMDLLGKMLRLDVNNSSTANSYDIPADNPFIGNPNALDEIWASGLRNPWRFSFDDVDNQLWIGDVGQNATEEVDRVTVNPAGYNFGWRCYEGSDPFNTTGCAPIGDFTFPVAEYPIPPCFCSVAGGQVYRGSVYSDILGVYIFGTTGDGTLSTVDASDNLVNHGDYGGTWVAFGEDINKEMYAVDIGGKIYKIKGGVLSVSDFSDPNLVAMTPNPASEFVTVNIKNDNINSIRILDLKGSIVFSEENTSFSEKNIAVNHLSQGMYLVKITSEKGASFIKKLVIK